MTIKFENYNGTGNYILLPTIHIGNSLSVHCVSFMWLIYGITIRWDKK